MTHTETRPRALAIGPDPAALLRVARDTAGTPDEWPFAPRFDPVDRWYARLSRSTDHEVWLLTWLPGQATELHDHGGSAGAFVVVSGTVTEQTVVTDPADGDRLVASPLVAGAGRQFGAHHIHRIANTGRRPAVTVHAYGPSLTAMTRYRIEGGRLRVAEVSRAGVDW